MTGTPSQFYDSEIGDFFAYRSPEDTVVMGFLIRGPEYLTIQDLDEAQTSQVVEDLLDVAQAMINADGRNSTDDVDFDVCAQASVKLNISPEVRNLSYMGKSHLMLRDYTSCPNVFEAMMEATETGKPPVFELDVVPDRDGELTLIEFRNGVTGEAS